MNSSLVYWANVAESSLVFWANVAKPSVSGQDKALQAEVIAGVLKKKVCVKGPMVSKK